MAVGKANVPYVAELTVWPTISESEKPETAGFRNRILGVIAAKLN